MSPLFEALFDCNIIWKSKYFETFHIEHRMYCYVIDEWLKMKKAQMTVVERVRYEWHKRMNEEAIKLGWRYYGVQTTN